MADGLVGAEASPADGAERAARRLREISAEVRECAVLDRGGKLLAATKPAEWEARAAELWDAVEDPAKPAPSQIHVAVEGGEVFALRSPGATVIAVCDRFALASLMFCDLRATLRDLDGRGGAAAR